MAFAGHFSDRYKQQKLDDFGGTTVLAEKGDQTMKPNRLMLFSVISMFLILSIISGAQHKQTSQRKTGMSGMEMDMAMMQSAHHKLMMAYMESMSAFASSLHEQVTKTPNVDVDAARATVNELRHNLDAVEALHQKHMQSMSSEMQSKMQMMMEKMDKDRAMLKDQVSALETDVQSDKPDASKLGSHANALVNHLTMMMNMHGKKALTKKKTGVKM